MSSTAAAVKDDVSHAGKDAADHNNHLRQRLEVVLAQATCANSTGRGTVDIIKAAHLLGQQSVGACDQAVVSLQAIIDTLPHNKTRAELEAVQKQARETKKLSHDALVGLTLLQQGSGAALAVGDQALAALQAAINSLNPEVGKVLKFSPEGSPPKLADVAAGATASGAGAAPTSPPPDKPVNAGSTCSLS